MKLTHFRLNPFPPLIFDHHKDAFTAAQLFPKLTHQPVWFGIIPILGPFIFHNQHASIGELAHKVGVKTPGCGLEKERCPRFIHQVADPKFYLGLPIQPTRAQIFF